MGRDTWIEDGKKCNGYILKRHIEPVGSHSDDGVRLKGINCHLQEVYPSIKDHKQPWKQVIVWRVIAFVPCLNLYIQSLPGNLGTRLQDIVAIAWDAERLFRMIIESSAMRHT